MLYSFSPYLDAYLFGCGGCVGRSESWRRRRRCRRRRRGGGEDLPCVRTGGALEAGLLESGTPQWAGVVVGMEGVGWVLGSGSDACRVGSPSFLQKVSETLPKSAMFQKGAKGPKCMLDLQNEYNAEGEQEHQTSNMKHETRHRQVRKYTHSCLWC